MVSYNLYFAEKAVEYYKSPTPEAELKNLIDDPTLFKRFKKDHEDAIGLLTTERDRLTEDLNNLTTENDALEDELDREKRDRDTEKKVLEANISTLDTNNKVLDADNKKLVKAVNDRDVLIDKMVDKADYDARVNERAEALNNLANKSTQYNALNGLVNALLNKWSVASLNALDVKIERYQRERNNARQNIADAKEPFTRICDRVNKKKTVIVGDLVKRQIRNDMNRVNVGLGYSLTVDEDSGEE